MNMRFIFASTYSAWNKLSTDYSKECITVNPQSSKWIRNVAPIANISKKALVGVAFAVCTIATAVWSLFTLPIRMYQWCGLEQEGLKQDFDHLTSAQQIQ